MYTLYQLWVSCWYPIFPLLPLHKVFLHYVIFIVFFFFWSAMQCSEYVSLFPSYFSLLWLLCLCLQQQVPVLDTNILWCISWCLHFILLTPTYFGYLRFFITPHECYFFLFAISVKTAIVYNFDRECFESSGSVLTILSFLTPESRVLDIFYLSWRCSIYWLNLNAL